MAKPNRTLEGVRRERTKRVVLSNINADKPFDQIQNIIFDYARTKHVRVTHVRLLRKRTHYDNTETYTVQVNITFDDFDKVINDDEFWPEDIVCREFIPRNQYREQVNRDNTNNGRYW